MKVALTIVLCVNEASPNVLPASPSESYIDDFSDIFSESLDGDLSDTPLPFMGYSDSDSFGSTSECDKTFFQPYYNTICLISVVLNIIIFF